MATTVRSVACALTYSRTSSFPQTVFGSLSNIAPLLLPRNAATPDGFFSLRHAKSIPIKVVIFANY